MTIRENLSIYHPTTIYEKFYKASYLPANTVELINGTEKEQSEEERNFNRVISILQKETKYDLRGVSLNRYRIEVLTNLCSFEKLLKALSLNTTTECICFSLDKNALTLESLKTFMQILSRKIIWGLGLNVYGGINTELSQLFLSLLGKTSITSLKMNEVRLPNDALMKKLQKIIYNNRLRDKRYTLKKNKFLKDMVQNFADVFQTSAVDKKLRNEITIEPSKRKHETENTENFFQNHKAFRENATNDSPTKPSTRSKTVIKRGNVLKRKKKQQGASAPCTKKIKRVSIKSKPFQREQSKLKCNKQVLLDSSTLSAKIFALIKSLPKILAESSYGLRCLNILDQVLTIPLQKNLLKRKFNVTKSSLANLKICRQYARMHSDTFLHSFPLFYKIVSSDKLTGRPVLIRGILKYIELQESSLVQLISPKNVSSFFLKLGWKYVRWANAVHCPIAPPNMLNMDTFWFTNEQLVAAYKSLYSTDLFACIVERSMLKNIVHRLKCGSKIKSVDYSLALLRSFFQEELFISLESIRDYKSSPFKNMFQEKVFQVEFSKVLSLNKKPLPLCWAVAQSNLRKLNIKVIVKAEANPSLYMLKNPHIKIVAILCNLVNVVEADLSSRLDYVKLKDRENDSVLEEEAEEAKAEEWSDTQIKETLEWFKVYFKTISKKKKVFYEGL
eukprot:augustus_masked-scaffold_9-processed-gene-0.57-mRNA-1 protein AED:1.00 eAED:1.00 QI:0/-1/0/0/-1/1/1/0/673